MRNCLIYTFIILRPTFALTQNIIPSLVAPLPDTVSESSGLALSQGINVWTHNDSGGKPEIYKIGKDGSLKQTVYLKNATASDYEDMTKDDAGNLYVGDFGDNLLSRQNYAIYKIPLDTFATDTITPQKISFLYPGQNSFDCEACFHYGQSLFLFTKTHNPGEYTKLFSLPDSSGSYTAALIDSFYFPSPVTAADINGSGNMILLLSYGKIYLLSSFVSPDFFSGYSLSFTIPLSQTEGIAFTGDTAAFITDEKFMGTGGNLYYFELTPLTVNNQNEPEKENLFIYPNPSVGIVNVDSEIAIYSIDIRDIQGKLIYRHADENRLPRMISRKIEYPAELSKGIYFLHAITCSGKEITRKILLQ